MKRCIKFWLIILLISICLFGCQKNQENTSESVKEQQNAVKETKLPQSNNQNKPEEEDSVNKGAGQESKDDVQQDEQQSPVKIQIYFSNDDATAFLSEEREIATLSPDAVLEVLESKGVTTGNVAIQKFEVMDKAGKSTIEMDFNEAFVSYLRSMGTTGEYYTMGSICNTFLSAYDCEQIKMTVNGDVVSTGHAEYPGYMKMFD